MVASTTIEPGYGIFVYEAALMHAYPDMVYSDRGGSSGEALVIWDRYARRVDVKRFDVDEPIEDNDEDFVSSEGQLYMYKKAPEKWFEDLIERGKKYEHLMDKMMVIASEAWGRY